MGNKIKIFTAFLFGFSVAFQIAFFEPRPHHFMWQLVFLSLNFLTENLRYVIAKPKNTKSDHFEVSNGIIISLAAAQYISPGQVGLLAGIPVVVTRLKILNKHNQWHFFFNFAQVAFAAELAALAQRGPIWIAMLQPVIYLGTNIGIVELGLLINGTPQNLCEIFKKTLPIIYIAYILMKVMPGFFGVLLFALTFLSYLHTRKYLPYNMKLYVVDNLTALVNEIENSVVFYRGHSQRVEKIVEAIGKKLNLPPQQLETLKLAARFHDIGLYVVDIKILNKPYYLTPTEFQEIKRHPKVGAVFIKQFLYFNDIAECILYHHKGLDGSGYPSDLDVSNMSLCARILQVQEAYDSMRSPRSYRHPVKSEVAIESLRRKKTVFDQSIVDILEDVLPELNLFYPTPFQNNLS